jgi:predicted HTH transcriptional regulator
LGEDSKNQFKSKMHNAEQVAKEITASANALVGIIYIGIEEDKNDVCSITGIE